MTATDSPTRPATAAGRVWAWVTYDEDVAYEASVRDERRPCSPLLPIDQVERLRSRCAADAADGVGLVDTLEWVGRHMLVQISGQYDARGDELRPDGAAMRTVIEADSDGLYPVGADWTWRVLQPDEIDPATATVRR